MGIDRRLCFWQSMHRLELCVAVWFADSMALHFADLECGYLHNDGNPDSLVREAVSEGGMNKTQLAQFAPAAALHADALIAACQRYDISTPERQAAFLANVAEETAGFTKMSESFNYSPEGLLKTFGTRISPSTAYMLGRQEGEHIVPLPRQEQIANIVYALKFGNGSTRTGDGWKYRGRYAGLTFKDNYHEASFALFEDSRLVDMPDIVAQPIVGALTAAWFFQSRGCNKLADEGAFHVICDRFNPGHAGLDVRIEWLKKAEQALGITSPGVEK